MSVFDRLRQWLDRLGRGRRGGGGGDRGRPRSANRASSFHVRWAVREAVRSVSVTLTVVGPPSVDRLYFWALQASFHDGGRRLGAGHLGLMWNPRHPGSMAVNWGGYDAQGAVLAGTASTLPSAPDNANTRDFTWVPGRDYRLAIEPGREPGGWVGSVTDLTTGVRTEVRELLVGGDELRDPMCWSEVFADCDHPTARVRWSAPVAGDRPVTSARLTFQDVTRGGCANTDVVADAVGVLQVTNAVRTAGTAIRFP